MRKEEEDEIPYENCKENCKKDKNQGKEDVKEGIIKVKLPRQRGDKARSEVPDDENAKEY